MSWNEQESKVALRNQETGELAFNAAGLSVNSITATVKALAQEIGRGARVRQTTEWDNLGPGAWFIIGPGPDKLAEEEDENTLERPQPRQEEGTGKSPKA